MIAYIFLEVIVGVLVALGAYWFWRIYWKQKLWKKSTLALLLIKIPLEQEITTHKKEDFKISIKKFEDFLIKVSALCPQFVFEAAVSHVGEKINFYLALPQYAANPLRDSIQNIWAGARVETLSGDYSIFNAHGVISAAYLEQKSNLALPIPTYSVLDRDPMSSILSGFNRVKSVGEGAALQILISPAPKETRKTIKRYIRLAERGEPAEKILEAGNFSGGTNENFVKILRSKISKPLFQINAHIITSADSPRAANNIMEGLKSGFVKLTAPYHNELRAIEPRNSQKLISNFIFRARDESQGMILNSEEIASFYHLPITASIDHRVEWLKTKEVPLPAHLPQTGVRLGVNDFHGEIKHIYLNEEDRRRHVYVVGQAGTGKSTLLSNMLIDDIENGKGAAILDPRGNLTEQILKSILKARRKDIIYFDSSDLWHPPGLNILEFNPVQPEEKAFIVDEIERIFNKLFPPDTMGPMFMRSLRYALLLLMEDSTRENATLADVPRIFTDLRYRKRKLERAHDPAIKNFWEKELAKIGGEEFLASITPYITSKFNNFITNDYVRPILSQSKSAFDFTEIMAKGKILLVNLAENRIGEINARILGMIFTSKFILASLSSLDTPHGAKYKDFNLYIDKFNNLTTDSILPFLSNSSKHHLNLILAHQFLAQLSEKMRAAVFSKIGSHIVFRVGVQDAEFLAKHLKPFFSANDLTNIDNFNAHAKILVRGQTTSPFNIKIAPTKVGDH